MDISLKQGLVGNQNFSEILVMYVSIINIFIFIISIYSLGFVRICQKIYVLVQNDCESRYVPRCNYGALN